MRRITFDYNYQAIEFVEENASEATIYVDNQTGKIVVEYFKK